MYDERKFNIGEVVNAIVHIPWRGNKHVVALITELDALSGEYKISTFHHNSREYWVAKDNLSKA